MYIGEVFFRFFLSAHSSFGVGFVRSVLSNGNNNNINGSHTANYRVCGGVLFRPATSSQLSSRLAAAARDQHQYALVALSETVCISLALTGYVVPYCLLPYETGDC